MGDKPLRVLILSHYFWPEPIPKPRELGEALIERGHHVEIVTGFPNYPEGDLYPGTRLRLLKRERVGQLVVRRTLVYPSHGKNLIGRLLNYGSFMLSGVIGGLASPSFDVMYVWHPPLSVGVTAAVIGFLRRRPFVYDVQDIWPESAIASGFLRPGAISSLMGVLEKIVYRFASHIMVVTDGAKQNLVGKGVPADKVTVVPHWFDDADVRTAGSEARADVRQRLGWQDRFVVLFAGNLGMMQGLDTIIHACAELPAASNVLVVLMGDGSDRERLQHLARSSGVLDRLAFIPRQPSSAMGSYFAAADALLVHLRASIVSSLVIPSKTVAYLAAAKPIIMANTGASADLVRAAGAGVVVEADDPAALATAIVRMTQTPEGDRMEMGRRGRRFFEANFTREVTLPKYVEVLQRTAERAHAK